MQFPPSATSRLQSLVAGPDGNLRFTESAQNRVGEINPTTHAIADFSLGAAGYAVAEGVVAAKDGNLYVAESGGSAVVAFSTSAHKVVATYPTPTANAAPTSISSGPDGNLWFAEAAVNQVGTIDLATKKVSEHTTGSGPASAIASDGVADLW